LLSSTLRSHILATKGAKDALIFNRAPGGQGFLLAEHEAVRAGLTPPAPVSTVTVAAAA